MGYSAIYMPMLEAGRPDPSRTFETEKQAYKYVYQYCCAGCRRKVALWLRLKRKGLAPGQYNHFEDYPQADNYPACACLWSIEKDD